MEINLSHANLDQILNKETENMLDLKNVMQLLEHLIAGCKCMGRLVDH